MSETKYVTKEQFDESIKALERKMKKMNAPPRAPRKPSDYNNFMASQMAKLKLANPHIDGKEAFKQCTMDWNKEKESKKNEKSTEKSETKSS